MGPVQSSVASALVASYAAASLGFLARAFQLQPAWLSHHGFFEVSPEYAARRLPMYMIRERTDISEAENGHIPCQDSARRLYLQNRWRPQLRDVFLCVAESGGTQKSYRHMSGHSIKYVMACNPHN
jgi:hypothetical protein